MQPHRGTGIYNPITRDEADNCDANGAQSRTHVNDPGLTKIGGRASLLGLALKKL